jgi:hypothetical protein
MSIHHLDAGAKTFKGICLVWFMVFKNKSSYTMKVKIQEFLVGCQELFNIATD